MINEIREQIEWLRKEAQRHSQSASDKAFTARRRGTFRHRAKKLRGAADTMEKLAEALASVGLSIPYPQSTVDLIYECRTAVMTLAADR